jgi:competence protein ComEA
MKELKMIRRLLILTLASWMVAAPLSVHAQPATTDAAPKAAASSAVINLNTATAPQLETLPGIGPKMAVRIVEYRQKNGSFKKIEELMNVKGIGEKAFLKLKSRLTVAPPKE